MKNYQKHNILCKHIFAVKFQQTFCQNDNEINSKFNFKKVDQKWLE